MTTKPRHLQNNETVKSDDKGRGPMNKKVFKDKTRRWINAELKGISKLNKQFTFAGMLDDLEDLQKSLTREAPLPLEKMADELQRLGHPVAQIYAVDKASQRMFFTTSKGQMYAEYDSGFSINKIGDQLEIAKEYDVVDLESEPRSSVVTTHAEEDYDEDNTPGIIPSGNPAIKPAEDEDDPEFVTEALEKSIRKAERMISDVR
jgi:hypothetical protein